MSKTLYKLVTVKVTAPLIRRGQPKDTQSCPVALAVRRAIKKPEVMVDDEVTWDEGFVALPARIRRWIQRFDLGKPVKPIEFTLRIRSDYL